MGNTFLVEIAPLHSRTSSPLLFSGWDTKRSCSHSESQLYDFHPDGLGHLSCGTYPNVTSHRTLIWKTFYFRYRLEL